MESTIIRGLIRIKEKISEGYIIDDEIKFIDNAIEYLEKLIKS
jgi:hypothetical protein